MAYLIAFIIFIIISLLMWYVSTLNKLENAEEECYAARKELDSSVMAEELLKKNIRKRKEVSGSAESDTIAAAEQETDLQRKKYREKIEIYNYAFDHFPLYIVTKLSGKKKIEDHDLESKENIISGKYKK